MEICSPRNSPDISQLTAVHPPGSPTSVTNKSIRVLKLKVRFITAMPRGNDWTNRFRKIAADAGHINAGSAIIDGEVVVLADDGTTDFSVLQNELKDRPKKIVLVAYPGKVDHGLTPATAKDLPAD